MAARERIPLHERRALPRCPLDTEVEISIQSQGNERSFQTRSINLSLRVLELSCGDELIQAILAQDMYPHECEIRLTLPDQDKAIKMKTQVVTHRRLSQREYQLVLRFVNPSKTIQEKLVTQLASLGLISGSSDKLYMAV